MQNQCSNGVYMEVFNNEILAKEPSFVNPENPFATCEERNFNTKDCYLYAPTYYTQVLDEEHSEVFTHCDTLPPELIGTCVAGTANEAAKRNQHDLSIALGYCDKYAETEYMDACVRGVATMTIFQTATTTQALQICSEAEPYSTTCRERVDLYTPLFDKI